MTPTTIAPPAVPETLSACREEAYEIGADVARTAAAEVLSGTEPRAYVALVLRLLEDASPRVDAYLPPCPQLDGRTHLPGHPIGLDAWWLTAFITGNIAPAPDVIDALAEAFDAGVLEAFAPACEAILRGALDA